MKGAAKRIVVEGLGWLLVAVGIAALVLPGPGLLALFAGVALLSTQYEWARRRLEPVRRQAFSTAEQSVRTWPRIVGSSLGALALVALGVLWGVSPPAPDWWPLRDHYWLLGGWGTGITLIFSGLIAGGMIGWSIVHFRGGDRDQPSDEQD